MARTVSFAVEVPNPVRFQEDIVHAPQVEITECGAALFVDPTVNPTLIRAFAPGEWSQIRKRPE